MAGQRFGIFRLVTTLIAIGGTALGVAALLITLAVMDGFRSDIQNKILGTQPNLTLTSPLGAYLPEDSALRAQLPSLAHIKAISPFIQAQSLIQSRNAVTGLLIRGIDPSSETQVTRLKEILQRGDWLALDARSVVLGEELARNVDARVGDQVTLVAPQQDMPTWGEMPRMRQYKVAGIFKSGMYEYDANLAYLSLEGARNLLGIGAVVSGYGVKLDDVDHALDVQVQLRQMIGGKYWVRSWEDLNRSLFSAMRLERTVMFLILTLIILVSGFTIVSNLLLLTMEKAREIGILQALGASPAQIGRIFLLNGLMLGGTGVGLGLGLGVGISWALKKYPLIRLPADVYYVDRLPINLSLTTIESVALCAMVLVLLSIFYPAHKARGLDPVQAIRYG